MSSIVRHKPLIVGGLVLFVCNIQVLGLPEILATTIEEDMECSFTTGGSCLAADCTDLLAPASCGPSSETYSSYKEEQSPYRHCKKDTHECCVTDENPDTEICKSRRFYAEFDCVDERLACILHTMANECAASYPEHYPQCQE